MKVFITFKVGDKKLNELIRGFDLGMEGVVVTDSLTFETRSKPSKKLKEKYIKAIESACKRSDKEVYDINILFLI